jgi:tetratricopeptide (TPR) repeat protein
MNPEVYNFIRKRFVEKINATNPDLDPVTWIEALNGFAQFHETAYPYSDNSGIYRQIAKVAAKAGLDIEWARAQVHIGAAIGRANQANGGQEVDKAIAATRKALAIFTPDIDRTGCAAAFLNLGNCHLHHPRGDRDANARSAVRCLERAQALLDPSEDLARWTMVQVSLGLALVRLGHGGHEDGERAIAILKNALDRLPPGLPPGLADLRATALNHLAIAFSERRVGNHAANIEDAIGAWTRSLDVTGLREGSLDQVRTLNGLAEAYIGRVIGDITANAEAALETAGKALHLLPPTGFPVERARTLVTLAHAYAGRPVGSMAVNALKGLELVDEALRLLDAGPWPSERARAQSMRATLLFKLRHHDPAGPGAAALAAAQEALAALDAHGDRTQRAGLLHNIGLAHLETEGEAAAAAAVDAFKAALDVYEPMRFPVEWARTQNAMGLACGRLAEHGKGPDAAAEAAFAAALSVFQPDVLPEEHIRTRLNLARFRFRKGEWSDAWPEFAAVRDCAARMMPLAFSQEGRFHTAALDDGAAGAEAFCLLRLGNLERALRVLEAGRARLMRDALTLSARLNALAPDARGRVEGLLETRGDLQRRYSLAVLDTERSADIQSLASALSRADAEVLEALQGAGAIDRARPMGLADARALAPGRGALLIPLLTEQGSAMMVIPGRETRQAEQVIWIDDFTIRDLSVLLRGANPGVVLEGWTGSHLGFASAASAAATPQAFQAAESVWQDGVDRVLRTVWERLVAPVHQCLRAMNLPPEAPLVVLAPGGLALLPLHAAWYPADGRRHYLMDDYTVSYAPSLAALQAARLHEATSRRPASVLIVTDPEEQLPGARLEAQAVARTFGQQVDCLQGSDATLSSVLARWEFHSHLHFSCHGAFDARNSGGSELRLAKGTALKHTDIITSHLAGCRLAVLGGCDSAMAEFRHGGNEFVGLPGAFLQAGVAGVIANLWQMEDRASQLGFGRFYELHQRQGQAPAKALRATQFWLRGQPAFAHPCYWAPLAFYGA